MGFRPSVLLRFIRLNVLYSANLIQDLIWCSRKGNFVLLWFLCGERQKVVIIWSEEDLKQIRKYYGKKQMLRGLMCLEVEWISVYIVDSVMLYLTKFMSYFGLILETVVQKCRYAVRRSHIRIHSRVIALSILVCVYLELTTLTRLVSRQEFKPVLVNFTYIYYKRVTCVRNVRVVSRLSYSLLYWTQ